MNVPQLVLVSVSISLKPIDAQHKQEKSCRLDATM